jgi:hypothetical protein
MRCVFALCALAILNDSAAAKVLITFGDTTHEYGKPGHKPIDFKDGGGVLRVGFKYDYAGIFWLDAWTWNGDYVLYNDAGVMQVLDRTTAADMLDVDESTIPPPPGYRFPPLPIAFFGIGVPLFVWWRLRHRAHRKVEEELGDDPSYRKALSIARGDETHADDDERFEDAVQELTLDGIDERTARRNLKMLLRRSQRTMG